MAVNIFVLTATGKLGKYKSRIAKAARKSIKIIKKKISIPDADIVFYDNPNNAIPHLGIDAFTNNINLVLVPLNPKFKNFDKTISEEMLRIFAHELHHCARMKAVGYGETLFEVMVSEGLADHFELEVTNKKPQTWDTALTAKQFSVLKKRAKKEYNNKNYNHNDWFFGSNDRKIPKWAGYTIGFNLVSEYLKNNPDKKPSELFAAKAEEFAK
jgi:uncharacterized protein YjaZ